MNQSTNDLQVGQIISTTGNVGINSGGQILNASGAMRASVGDTQSQQVWQTLGLMNSKHTAPTITAFQNEVDTEYQAELATAPERHCPEWVLSLRIPRPSALYQGLTALAPRITNPATVTSAQVQTYASGQIKLRQLLQPEPPRRLDNTAPFTTFNTSFSYVATAAQQSALTQGAVYTMAQLTDPVAQVALDPTAGLPVGITTPNIAGTGVTLTSGGNIGNTGQTFVIPLTTLQSGNLTATQMACFEDSTAPGDILLVGTVQGQTVMFPLGQQPTGFTITGIQVSNANQVNVSATGAERHRHRFGHSPEHFARLDREQRDRGRHGE